MAAIRAAQSGNWSATSTWTGGVLPGNGDTVYANGFNVTIDQNANIGGANNVSVNAGSFVAGQRYVITTVGTTSWTSIGAASNTAGVIFTATGAGSGTGVASTLATITTAAATGTFTASAGGGFTLSGGFSLTADCVSGTTVSLTFAANSPATASVSGNIYAGTTAGAHGAIVSGTGTLTITGNVFAGQSGLFGCQNSSSGTLNIIGNVTGGSGTNGYGANNNSTGTLSITGSVFGGAGAANAPGVNNNSTGTIIVTGSVIAQGSSHGFTAVSSTAHTNIVVGSIFASTQANGVNISSVVATNRFSGSTYDASNGYTAIFCSRYFLNTTPTQAVRRVALDGTSTFVNFYTADFSGFGQPSVADVRAGTVYAAGALTGTCAVPSPSNVDLGTPVGSTVGTAVLTPASVQSALTAYGASKLTSADITSAVIPLV